MLYPVLVLIVVQIIIAHNDVANDSIHISPRAHTCSNIIIVAVSYNTSTLLLRYKKSLHDN